MSRDRRPPRRALLILLGIAMGSVVPLGLLATQMDSGGDDPGLGVAPHPGPFRGNVLPKGVSGRQAPRVRLGDARGATVDTAELRGRPYALTFLYVNCPDVCPVIGAELRRGLELLGRDRPNVTVIAVSVDPRADTPQAVRSWVRRHRLPHNFRYLIGSERQLRPVWDSYYAAPQIPGRPESSHSASIWLIDRVGRWRTKFSAGPPVPPRDIAHDFRVLLAE